MAELDDGETATSTLLADYAASAPTPSRTPMRTPTEKSDVVLTEAQNLIALTNQQTPLAAEENVQLHASDFSGITPQRQASATPNPIATPGGSSVRGSIRGSVRSTPGQTPGQTPLRDELRINSEMTEDETQEKLLRMQVMSGLSQLPGPKNEYQIQVPEMDEAGMSDDLPGNGVEEDAADRKERLKKQKEAEAAARLKLMSQPLQRGLPRPNHKTLTVHAKVTKGSSALEQAAALVEAEIGAIVAYEAGAYPVRPETNDDFSIDFSQFQ